MNISTAALVSVLTIVPSVSLAQNPTDSVDALEGLFGKQQGARRSQAKGYCVAGTFSGTAEGRSFTVAPVLTADKVPALVRFSVGGGNPKASDKSKSTRGMAVQLNLPNGQVWMQGNLSVPIYFVKDPRDFAPFVRARTADPATGKVDQQKLAEFNAAHPETLWQGQYLAQRNAPASFASTRYWGINAFVVRDRQGAKQFVRWHYEPAAGDVALTDEEVKALPDNFLLDELRERLKARTIAFDLILQVAEPGDNVLDPTVQWPSKRRQVRAGRLVLDRVDEKASCDPMLFNPLVLPDGIEPSDDPVLLARPGAYAVSLARRSSK